MKQVIKIHKWIALSFCFFWILQAISGAMLVFQHEIIELGLNTFKQEPQLQNTPPDFTSAIERLKKSEPKHTPLFLINRSDKHGVFDLVSETVGEELQVYRLSASNGETLETFAWKGAAYKLGFFRLVHLFHTRLLLGTAGHWVIGVSGLFLCITVALGLYIGWPRSGSLKHILKPKPIKLKVASLYAWHRAIGLWCAIILLIIVPTGTALVWLSPLKTVVGASHPTLITAQQSMLSSVSIDDAIRSAYNRFPKSKLALVTLPQPERPYYQIRLTQPDENRLKFGTTTLYIDKYEGRILYIYDPLGKGRSRIKAVDNIYPLHTGEIWGPIGRLIYFFTAIFLTITIIIASLLFYKKRKR